MDLLEEIRTSSSTSPIGPSSCTAVVPSHRPILRDITNKRRFESLTGAYQIFKNKLVNIHEELLTSTSESPNVMKSLHCDLVAHAFTFQFILKRFEAVHQTASNFLDLSLADQITESERIRDTWLFYPQNTVVQAAATKSHLLRVTLPVLTKEKFDRFSKFLDSHSSACQSLPSSHSSSTSYCSSAAATPIILNLKSRVQAEDLKQSAKHLNTQPQMFNIQRLNTLQTITWPNPNASNNNQPTVVNSSNQPPSSNSNQPTYNQQQQQPPPHYQQQPPPHYQQSSYPNQTQRNPWDNQNPHYRSGGGGGGGGYSSGSGYSNNRNRYQNNKYNYRNNNRGEDDYSNNNTNHDQQNNGTATSAGSFVTATDQAQQNHMYKRQREDGYYKKESGRYGRNQGQIELEGIAGGSGGGGNPKQQQQQQQYHQPTIDQAMGYSMGKTLNNYSNSYGYYCNNNNQPMAMYGGGYEDERPKGALSKQFKPPCAPGSATNKPGNADQLKGMDQKLIDLIENEIVENSASVKWDDIAGLSSAKSAVHESIVWPMLNPAIFTGIRAPPKGLLLFGPPGTGKTMIGKAIACESNSTFFSISASSLTSKYIGEGEKLVKILFKLALQKQPSVIFIDEIDSLLCSRQENENEASRRIKTEFLVQMEGAQSKGDERILLIGATNRPQELDDAVRRRFVKKLYIPLPNLEARSQLIKRIIDNESQKGTKFDIDSEGLVEVVKMTKGYSGADMRNLCTEASLIPIRSCSNISMMSFEDIRAIVSDDFLQSLKLVKATVTKKDLIAFLEWNNNFGSFEINLEDIDN